MRPATALAAILLTAVLGCNNSNTAAPTPDQIRHDTAAATATVAGDIKGAAEGIKDGLHQAAGPVNINTATRPQLETLPGVDPVVANLIIHHRPYSDPSDLIKKHVLTGDQYDKLSSRIKTSD